MLIQTFNPTLIPALAQFLIEQRRSEMSLDDRLWLVENAEEKLGKRLELTWQDRDEQIWVALDEPTGKVVGALGARAKALGPEDVRRTYLPENYGLLQLATLGVAVGRWQEILPRLWKAARDWLLDRRVNQPQVWINQCNLEAAEAWQRLGFVWLMDNAVRPLTEIDRFPGDVSPSLRVRPANLRDVRRILPLFIEELDFHARLPGNYWMPVDGNTPRLARREIELFLTAGTAYVYLLAENARDGELLGYMSASAAPLLPENSNTLFHPLDRSILQVAIVTRTARGQGVGDVLLNQLLGWFWQQDARSVSLSYDIRNPLSGPFWRNHGFEALRQALVINLP